MMILLGYAIAFALGFLTFPFTVGNFILRPWAKRQGAREAIARLTWRETDAKGRGPA